MSLPSHYFLEKIMKNNKIILQPKYVDAFQCDGAKCNAKCCGNWRIDIDMESYKDYQRIKNPVIRKKILSCMKPSEVKQCFQINLRDNGVCPMVCDDSLCYIQRNLGADALSITCQTYPRNVVNIGNCQLRLLSLSCPIAAEKALFSADGMYIQQKEKVDNSGAWQWAVNVEDKAKIHTDELLVANVILGGLSILQNTAYTREQRLVVLGLFLDRAEEIKHDAKAVAELLEYYNGDNFKKEVSILWNDWKFYRIAHKQFLTGILHILNDERKIEIIEPFIATNYNYEEVYEKEHDAMEEKVGIVLDRYCQHEWLFHGFPFYMDGGFIHNYFAYLIAYKIAELYIYTVYDFRDNVSKERFINGVGVISRIMDHKAKFIDILVKETAVFEKEPLKFMQVLLRIK